MVTCFHFCEIIILCIGEYFALPINCCLVAGRVGLFGYRYALSLSGPGACTVPARSLYDCCHVTNSYVFFLLSSYTTCELSEVEFHNTVLFCSVLFCSVLFCSANSIWKYFLKYE